MKTTGSGVLLEVIGAVSRWETKRGLNVLSQDGVRGALGALVNNGCGSDEVVAVLDLFHAYGLTAPLNSAKQKRKRWIKRAKNLVVRLRRDAKDAEWVLDFVRSSPRPQEPEQVESNLGEPSCGERPPSYPPSDPESNWLQPELWDVMRTYADNLEPYIAMEQDKNLPLGEVFTRRFAGMVFCLVLAAGLMEAATGQPHYPQLATLLGSVRPTETLDEKILEKRINGFKRRNPEFVEEYLGEKQVRQKIRELLSALDRALV